MIGSHPSPEIRQRYGPISRHVGARGRTIVVIPPRAVLGSVWVIGQIWRLISLHPSDTFETRCRGNIQKE